MPDSSMDRPVYSGEMFQEQGPSPLDGIKPYFGKIIIAVIALIALYFIYSFFIGSYQTVQLRINGIDGIPVEGLNGSIMQNGQTVKEISANSQSLSLKQGTYEIELSADGLLPYSESLEITSQTKNLPISLEKDTGLEIAGVKLSANDNSGILFIGENNIVISLNNKGSQETAEIIQETQSGVQTALKSSAVIPASAENTPVEAKITVSSRTINDKANGDDLELKFRIKGTSTEFSRIFKVREKLQISASVKNIDFGKAKAINTEASNTGQIEKEFTIQNKETFDIPEPASFAITVNSTTNNPEEAKTWVSLIPEQISSLAKGNNAFKAFLKVPATAKPEKIYGTITASAQSWSVSTNFSAEIIAAKILISQPKISLESATITKGESKSGIELSIKNDTDFLIENLTYTISQNCNESFITVPQPQERTLRIPIGSTVKVLLQYNAPVDSAAGTTVLCSIQVKYNNPVSIGEIIGEEQELQPIIIQITPRQPAS